MDNKRWLVETFFSKLKMFLGERTRGKNFKNVVIFVFSDLFIITHKTPKSKGLNN